jgi:hypothetical protein
MSGNAAELEKNREQGEKKRRKQFNSRWNRYSASSRWRWFQFERVQFAQTLLLRIAKRKRCASQHRLHFHCFIHHLLMLDRLQKWPRCACFTFHRSHAGFFCCLILSLLDFLFVLSCSTEWMDQ